MALLQSAASELLGALCTGASVDLAREPVHMLLHEMVLRAIHVCPPWRSTQASAGVAA